MIRNYYARRILDPDLWKRLLTGKVPLKHLLLDPWHAVRAKLKGHRAASDLVAAATPVEPDLATGTKPDAHAGSPDLPSALIACRQRFRGQLATVLSGTDLTAAETESLMSSQPRWKAALEGPSAQVLRIAQADHTFSDPVHWAQAAVWLAQRMRS